MDLLTDLLQNFSLAKLYALSPAELLAVILIAMAVFVAVGMVLSLLGCFIASAFEELEIRRQHANTLPRIRRQ